MRTYSYETLIHSLDLNTTILPILQDIDDKIISCIQEDLNDGQQVVEGSVMFHSTLCTWVFAIICSALVGLSGLLPVIFTPETAIRCSETEERLCNENESCKACCNQKGYKSTYPHKSCDNNNIHSDSTKEKPTSPKRIEGRFKYMLCFAVGSLLGDVFLHLLPEAYAKLYTNSTFVEDSEVFIHTGHITIGIWCISGILAFVLIEMLYNSNKYDGISSETELDSKDICQMKSNLTSPNDKIEQVVIQNKNTRNSNKTTLGISGYLNVIANGVDNFFNGLGVGAAFLTGTKAGVTTTLCILVHEIPNGMGDFAILIKSGFSRYDTALAQLSIASVGIIGAFIALALDTLNSITGDEYVEDYTSWIIPFNCGGFINISLVTVLPDIMDSNGMVDGLKTLGFIGLGIFSIVGISGL